MKKNRELKKRLEELERLEKQYQKQEKEFVSLKGSPTEGKVELLLMQLDHLRQETKQERSQSHADNDSLRKLLEKQTSELIQLRQHTKEYEGAMYELKLANETISQMEETEKLQALQSATLKQELKELSIKIIDNTTTVDLKYLKNVVLNFLTTDNQEYSLPILASIFHFTAEETKKASAVTTKKKTWF